MAKAVPLQLGVEHQSPIESPPPRDDNQLSQEFMEWDLARSGLVPADMAAYPAPPLAMRTIGAYVIPFPDPRMWKLRIDRRLVEGGEKQAKYRAPSGIADVWWPHDRYLESYRLGNVLVIIEGEKKAAKFHKQFPEEHVIGITGCWNALYALDSGAKALLPNISNCLKPGKTVLVIFDGDIESNYNIHHAAHSLSAALELLQCKVVVYKPPFGKGVDDWLVEDPNGKLDDLVAVPLETLEMGRKQLFKKLELTTNMDGQVIMNDDNAARILGDYFKDRAYFDRRLGLIVDGEPGNYDELEAQSITYVQRQLLHGYASAKITSGLKIWINQCIKQKHDLIQEMVRASSWDNVPRLDTWGSEYFETEFPAWANEWGRLLFTGLGLRILQPGTKVDNVCILAGPQGIGKSTFFEQLGSFDEHTFYHACTAIGANEGDNNRTQAISFGRSVVVDLAEGVIFETGRIKGAMDRIKQIITQTHDEYREVYSKSTRIDKRGFVFVGTTNRKDQHGDQTGSRRFINMWVTKIKRMDFYTKMQLLAEVAAQEAPLRNSAWWELRVTVDQAPEKLREGREHIENIQELVNSDYQRSDADTEFVLQLLEAGECARLKEDPEVMYITTGYASARRGITDGRGRNAMARTISALAGNPTCPFKFESFRKRIPQLVMTTQQDLAYRDGVSNAQMMLNGYCITRK